ncbi:YdeI/OmpD-associated family protein [Algoriphagus terrigena]|uniref:YdeI/OmpD-associated family protein n=1 Tax=Algoriphagus terrigena TaxID=344884 RepID=UPI000423FA2A|nr:YdeI/OmpD-associated family protein [Algoriphagus terrigena]
MELILEGEFLLERFAGKGGWTFVRVPVSRLPGGKAFGMVKLNGSIDEFEFVGKHLMPMKKGILFLPVSKPIRTQIGKEEGDVVLLKLYREDMPSTTPQELIDCLEDDPGKLSLFYLLRESEQKEWVEFIYSADSDDVKASRIVKLLDELKPDS